MDLRFFAVMPCFLRSTDIAVTVRECQQLQHHERMRLSHSNMGGKVISVWKFAGDGVKVRLYQSDRPARACACVHAVLNIHSKSFSRLYSSGAMNSMRIFSALPGIGFSN